MNFLLIVTGLLLMLLALASSFVTVATQNASGYRGVLATALVTVVPAIACFTILFIRGSLLWRFIAVLLSLPALFVISEILRRAPAAFGGG
jgi:hypothetical protein